MLTKNAFNDLSALQRKIALSIQAVLVEHAQMPLHFRVESSVVSPEQLVPEGMVFDIHFRVEIHERTTKDDNTQKPAG